MSGITDAEALEVAEAMVRESEAGIDNSRKAYAFFSYVRDIIAARVAAGGGTGGVGHGD